MPLALLVPDLFMAGYLGGTRLGAQLYNIAHSAVLPTAMACLGRARRGSADHAGTLAQVR